jgi:hypothetical protein
MNQLEIVIPRLVNSILIHMQVEQLHRNFRIGTIVALDL